MSMSIIDLPVPDILPPPDPDPMDWVTILLRRIQARRPDLRRWQDYYRGDHPLSWMTDSFREAFRGRFDHFASNFTMLVVDGLAERLEVQGFRFRDKRGDDDLWAIWQDNDLDAGSQQAHTEAIIKGVSYALIEPRRDERPRITIEDALDTITMADPRDRRRRLAGLKCWLDDDGHLIVYLYLPDEVYTWRSMTRLEGTLTDWLEGGRRTLGERLRPWRPQGQDDWPAENPLGLVPLVPLVNRPLSDGIGRSEVAPITSNQDAINYLRMCALIASGKVAIPQRYIYGLDLEVDPSTGRPKRPFVTDAGRPADTWVIENPPEDAPPPPFPPQIGQFPAADMGQYIRLIEAEVWQMAAVSRMPYEELLSRASSSIPQSGEGIKSSEHSLIRKVGKTQIHFGDGWEEVMRIALRAMQDERADARVAETIWQSPETRNEAVRTDSIVKQWTTGIIDHQTALEQLGYSPAQVTRIMAQHPATAPTTPVLGTAPTGPRMSPTIPVAQEV